MSSPARPTTAAPFPPALLSGFRLRRCLRRFCLSSSPSDCSSSSVPWSFGPSLQPHYGAFSATTASADFSEALTPELSPGKVLILSPRADRLYLTRLGGLRASLFPASSPPAPGLTAAFCSFSRGFASRFLQLHLAVYALRFGYGCHHRLRKVRFNFIESAHAGHTGAGSPPLC